MAGNKDFAELLKEVCMEEEVANGLDLSKFKTVKLGDYAMEAKGYELELTQQGCDVQQVEFVEPKSYYTTYYGQDVATVGTARGYYRYVNDFHAGASGRSDRTIKLANPFEVELL